MRDDAISYHSLIELLLETFLACQRCSIVPIILFSLFWMAVQLEGEGNGPVAARVCFLISGIQHQSVLLIFN